MLSHYILQALISGSIIAITAVGFALVYNTTRIFHIAYAALYTLSGYLFYQFFELNGYSFLVALGFSMLITACMSLCFELFIYRLLSKRKMASHSLMIASIGLLIITNNIIIMIWGNSPRIVSQNELLPLGVWGLDANRLLFFFTYILVLLLLYFSLKKGRFASILKAMRDNTALLGVLGINVLHYRSLIFILSGLLIALCGALQAFDTGVNPNVGLPVFIYAFIALIIGGIGRFEGPILGGFVIGFLQTTAEYFISSQWVILTIFVLLLLFLFYLPKGILPEKRREL